MITVIFILVVLGMCCVCTCFAVRDAVAEGHDEGLRSPDTVEAVEPAGPDADDVGPVWTARDDRQLTRLLKSSSR